MRTVCGLLIGCLLSTAAPWVRADEADGLLLPRLQTRVRLGMATEAGTTFLAVGAAGTARLGGASVLGDYYFSDRALAGESHVGGFRATTGVFLGSRLGMWGGPAASAGNSLISVESYNFSLLAPRGSDLATQDNGTVPYLGIGYSGWSLISGLSFSADLGMIALNPGSAVRLGRVFGGGQNLEDVLRDVRLSPLLQLAVSYRF